MEDMTEEKYLSKIWEYYLMLENKFIKTFQYVEPNSNNKKTYSKEYINLLLSICSEIDVICKELCKVIEGKKSEDVEKYNMKEYVKVINYNDKFSCEKNKNLITLEELSPWSGCEKNNSLDWWQNYNKLKHDRLNKDNYMLGNYENVENALSALYINCRVLYIKRGFKGEPFPKSSLFKMCNWVEYTSFSYLGRQ